EPAGFAMGGEQRFDPRAEVGVVAARTVQIAGPDGRVGPLEGLSQNYHREGIGIRHRIASETAVCCFAPVGAGPAHGVSAFQITQGTDIPASQETPDAPPSETSLENGAETGRS